MSNGFYFKKLTASGPNKKDAEIKFEKGLNVLTGPSNTGKSYILQCLNYMLGSLDPPKSIPEANGYNLMRAEMGTFDDQVFTLERKFANDYSDKYMMLYKPDSQTGQSTSQFLHVRYSKNQANVSSFLLGLLNITEKNLISSEKYHDTKGLSFRDLARFCIVDETRMTADKSPIYYDDLEDKTLNKSLFRFVLTGEDDDGTSRIERPEITKIGRAHV
jgi:energy-coupling factor transporter ATP-binding protein EcfA2